MPLTNFLRGKALFFTYTNKFSIPSSLPPPLLHTDFFLQTKTLTKNLRKIDQLDYEPIVNADIRRLYYENISKHISRQLWKHNLSEIRNHFRKILKTFRKH